MASAVILIRLFYSSLLVIAVSSASSEIYSCDLVAGILCYPTACMNNVCVINKNATCIPDRCGCEARFFLESVGGHRDITKLCGNFNAAQKILQFHQEHDTPETTNDEMEVLVSGIPFHLNVNYGLSQLLESLARSLRNSKNHLWDADRIFVLRQANNAVRALRRARVILVQAEDEMTSDETVTRKKKIVKAAKLSENNVITKQGGTPTPVVDGIKKPAAGSVNLQKILSASSQILSGSIDQLQKAFNLNKQIIEEIVKQNGVFNQIVEQSDDETIVADKDFLSILAAAIKEVFGGKCAVSSTTPSSMSSTTVPTVGAPASTDSTVAPTTKAAV